MLHGFLPLGVATGASHGRTFSFALRGIHVGTGMVYGHPFHGPCGVGHVVGRVQS